MEVCVFTDLATRQAYRAVYALHSGRLYVEQLRAGTWTSWEVVAEADFGHFGRYDLQLLSTVAAGRVELGRAVFHVVACSASL